MSVVGGFAHLHGKVIGPLRVVQREPGTPFRWRCVCTVCGVSQVQRHDVLMTGFPRCVNSACGKRPQTADEWFAAAKKEERQQTEQRAKEQKEQADRKARLDADRKRQADAEAAAKKARADDVAAKKAEAERKNRKVMFDIATDDIAATLDFYGLTGAEREIFFARLPHSELTNPFPTFPKFICEEIIEQRGKQ